MKCTWKRQMWHGFVVGAFKTALGLISRLETASRNRGQKTFGITFTQFFQVCWTEISFTSIRYSHPDIRYPYMSHFSKQVATPAWEHYSGPMTGTCEVDVLSASMAALGRNMQMPKNVACERSNYMQVISNSVIDIHNWHTLGSTCRRPACPAWLLSTWSSW